MKPFQYAIIILLLWQSATSDAENNFEAEGIVPDVIAEEPPSILSVTYSGNKQVNLGNELKPSEVQTAPVVNWDANPSSYYTLAMVDPDAPSRADPLYREVEHWLVVNIPGDEIANGDVIADYIGSAPPKDSGLHRYVFFVYNQNGRIEFDELGAEENRINFSIKTFAEKYGLGQPIAGNFFLAQNEENSE